jgi:hypothetical protein
MMKADVRAMAAIRDLRVHVNDEVTSRHAIELAAALAAELGARPCRC